MESIKSLLPQQNSKLQGQTTKPSQVTVGGIPVPQARENIKEYYDPDILQNRWEVNYGLKEKFYLNDIEHRWFLEQIKQGAEIVQVGQLTLTKRFLFIVPLKNKPKDPPEYEEITDANGNKMMRLKK